MKKGILLILCNVFILLSLLCASPSPIDRSTNPLHIVSNTACTLSILCRMLTLSPEKENEDIKKISLEPGQKITLNFEDKELFHLRGISVRPHRNLPIEYTEPTESELNINEPLLPEYGIMFESPPTLGIDSLVLVINETFNIEGYILDRGVITTHSLNCIIKNTGEEKGDSLFKGELPYQPSSKD